MKTTEERTWQPCHTHRRVLSSHTTVLPVWNDGEANDLQRRDLKPTHTAFSRLHKTASTLT